MKLLKKFAALFMIVVMMISSGAGAAFAEIEGWQSALLDVFGAIISEYVDDDSSGQVYEDKKPGDYSYSEYDSEDIQSYYEYDWPITEPQQIVNYLYEYGELPDNFITKDEARELGWDSSRNYVGDVAPDMSIGGDRFGNYEGLLPDAKGRKWYECDANYAGKKRGAERVVFSSDGLFFYTDDHYESFTEMFPED